MEIVKGINITNEDNMDLMARYPDNYFELAIVDPPYGIDVTKMTLGNGRKKINRGTSDWDGKTPSSGYFEELRRVSKNQIIWGANYMTENLPPSMGWIYWDKGTGANDFSDGELAYTSFNRALRSFKVSWVGANANNGTPRIHPTEKPIKLYQWMLDRYAKEGDKILDTHLGSGSIAIACHERGFELTACELDKDYYEAACKRIKQQTAQQSLF
jgi:site-specific DNA-methyltransferase (adenine-specific)